MGILSKIKFNKVSGTFVLETTKKVIDIADVVRMLERRLESLAPMLQEMLPLDTDYVEGLLVKGVEFSPSKVGDLLGVRFNVEIKFANCKNVWRSKTPLLYLKHETSELALPEDIRKQLELLIQESEDCLDAQQVDMFAADGDPGALGAEYKDNGQDQNREDAGVQTEPVAA